ncbi:MAG: hypothetical protein AB7I52_15410 [Rhizobiaceae bacterium]
MLRFVALLVLLLVAAWLVLALAKQLKGLSIDWKGVAFAVGFVALAFWLRQVTGLA